MKSQTLTGAIGIRVFVVAVFFLIIAIIISAVIMNDIESEVYASEKENIQHLVREKVTAKQTAGITNAVSISQNSSIIKALQLNDRELAIKALEHISSAMKKGTPFKNIKVHVHDKDVHSFVRSWKLSKFGDDLTSFRATINKVKETKQTLSAVEVGRAGLVLRGLSPIISNGEYLGSLEFIMGYNSIVKSFAKRGKPLLVLMDEKFKRGNALTNEKKVQNYLISQKVIDKKFKKAVENLDFKKLKSEGTYLDEQYFYSYVPIKDLNGKEIGIYLIGEDIEVINEIINHSSNIVKLFITVIIIMIIALVIVTNFVVRSIVTSGINKFDQQFKKFLDFANFRTNRYIPLEVTGSDEISQMIESLNETAIEVAHQLQDDMKVLGEITITTDKVEQGIYQCRIHSTTKNPMIQTLSTTINKMIDAIDRDMNELRSVLKAYTSDDFTKSITVPSTIKEDMLKVMERVNQLGESLSKSAKQNLSNGQHLEANAATMTESVTNLANKANQQAASLEETAAAVEEITSITRNNANNAVKMSELGNQVKSEVTNGMNMANKTSNAMDEINEQVGAISEAIMVIDQIAFQTNILSLNAAVEAATAGEAGKGFAVVAQEVRNLAARSAEAANEIKAIVETARDKANEGKNVSDEMIGGYESLNKNFNETIQLIQNVSEASKEQMTGIEQINDAVSTLDKVTQENAAEANSVAGIASEVSTLANSLVADAESKKF